MRLQICVVVCLFRTTVNNLDRKTNVITAELSFQDTCVLAAERDGY
jgi:hypothetical protein